MKIASLTPFRFGVVFVEPLAVFSVPFALAVALEAPLLALVTRFRVVRLIGVHRDPPQTCRS